VNANLDQVRHVTSFASSTRIVHLVFCSTFFNAAAVWWVRIITVRCVRVGNSHSESTSYRCPVWCHGTLGPFRFVFSKLGTTFQQIQCSINIILIIVVSDTRKFDRVLSQLLHEELHWLDVPQCIEYKLSVMVHRCRYGSAPQYLKECCTSVADVAGRQHLRSARRQLMDVRRYRRRTFGRRAFSVTGPTVWNSLSNTLREQSDEDSFKRQLKTFLFFQDRPSVPSALEIFWQCAI